MRHRGIGRGIGRTEKEERKMTIVEQLRKILKESMKSGDHETKNHVRLVIGELDRSIGKSSDGDAVAALKKLSKLEKETLSYKGEEISSFLEFVESFLPKQATPEEIEAWLEENVDFGTLKNKMQAVGIAMKHFGQNADGKTVKNVVQEKF